MLEQGARLDLKAVLDLNRLDLAEQILRAEPAQAQLRFGTGLTLLHDVARAGNLEAMRLLMRYGADPDALTNWGATPLHLAAINGQDGAVDFLIGKGANLNLADDRGRTPLALAEGKGHTACANVLRQNGGTRK